MFIRSATMPLLLISFLLSAYSGVVLWVTFNDEGIVALLGFLRLGLSVDLWSGLHAKAGLITILLAMVHVLLDLKTLVWSCKYVLSSFRRKPKPKDASVPGASAGV